MKKLEILKNLNALYVDDDKDACESLGHILEYYFKTVFIAYNGAEAFEIYEKKSCDFLIVDYDMPIMNGFEFLSKVRQKDNETQAIIISSYDDKIKLKSAIPLKLLGYLTKPYKLEELTDIFEQLAKHHQDVSKTIYITDCCYYDSLTKVIISNDEKITLTAYEAKLLEYLLENRGSVVSYDTLLDILNSKSHKSLVSAIYRIHKKLSTRVIENVKDMGYMVK